MVSTSVSVTARRDCPIKKWSRVRHSTLVGYVEAGRGNVRELRIDAIWYGTDRILPEWRYTVPLDSRAVIPSQEQEHEHIAGQVQVVISK